MKPVLYVAVLVLGLALIGLSVAVLRTVDEGMNLQADKPREAVGLATQRDAAMPPPRIDMQLAQRLTMLASTVGVLGAVNVMIGTVLIAAMLLERSTTRGSTGRARAIDRAAG